MSSSSGPLTKDLQCSICLEVFTDPVSTPCGHNFCKSCLNKCWSNSQTCSCPYCKETFTQRPDLKTNTTLREISERYGQNPSRLQMTLMIQDTQKMIQDRIKTIQDLKHSARVRIRNLNQSKAAHVKLCTDLIRSIERWHTEQLEMMEEQQKAAEKQEEELIEELEQEITELKMRNTELEQLSHTEDHLHLLQIYSFLQCRPADTRNWNEISLKTCDSLETLRKSLDLLKNTVEEKLSQTVLKWMQQYAVDVTLDPDTAQPELILSADGKQVRHGNIRQRLQNKPQRFDRYLMVMGKEGFSSGRFYYEVQVKGKTGWDVGVAQESINRKGEILPSPSNRWWTLILRNRDKYINCTSPSVSIPVRVKPQRVGVFVDYEERLISFYDAESGCHIYSYTGQTFTGKLSPYLSPCYYCGGENSDPLIITPVN